MPRCFLDGEIWLGRGTHSTISFIPSDNLDSSKRVDSSLLRYVVFDNPDPCFQLSKLGFESRYGYLMYFVDNSHSFTELTRKEDVFVNPIRVISLAPRVCCIDNCHMERYFSTVVHMGGEGVMLRLPYSAYQAGRSLVVLKLKTKKDAEALIVKVHDGYCVCKLANAIVVCMRVRNNIKYSVKKGDVVSFSYVHTGKDGAPKDPWIYKIREDMKWENVDPLY